MSSKAQKLVNEIYKFYSLDVSNLSDSELDDLTFALGELKDLDREDLESPTRPSAKDDLFEEDEDIEELNFEEEPYEEDDED
jgi:hypothetical protein